MNREKYMREALKFFVFYKKRRPFNLYKLNIQ